jgi:hypothetical protein
MSSWNWTENFFAPVIPDEEKEPNGYFDGDGDEVGSGGENYFNQYIYPLLTDACNREYNLAEIIQICK